jgi:5-methylthioadenosine/S-adenosylhomocysteine deaminase
MKILFRKARILSLKDNAPIFQGYLATEDDKISYVGDEEPRGQYDKTIDCDGDLLMPGFKDAHTHSAMTFARSFSDDLPLHDWLYHKVFSMEDNLKTGDYYTLCKVAILEYLGSGITSCFDMYYHSEEMAKACVEMGYRSVFCGTITKYKDSIEGIKRNYAYLNSLSPLIHAYIGFHAEYTSTPEILESLSSLSHELHCPVYSHNSETLSETEECKKRHDGLSPTEVGEKYGLYDYGGGGFHCIYFSNKDIEIFKKHHCSVITCPGSNAKLASGIAPLVKFEKEGLNLALGTDGPGSNNGLNFFYEMKLACILQKLLLHDAAAFDATAALKAATLGGAKALGLDCCDTLTKGKQADIIMLNLHRPNMQPLNNIEKNIVYSGAEDDVKMTMVAGKILYMDGAYFVGENPEEIYAKAQEVTDRLKK